MADVTWTVRYRTADGLEALSTIDAPEGQYPPARLDRMVSRSLRIHRLSVDPEAGTYSPLHRRRYEIAELDVPARLVTYVEDAP